MAWQDVASFLFHRYLLISRYVTGWALRMVNEKVTDFGVVRWVRGGTPTGPKS